jgi:hypothetical protein
MERSVASYQQKPGVIKSGRYRLLVGILQPAIIIHKADG